jgi:hypothetical protein
VVLGFVKLSSLLIVVRKDELIQNVATYLKLAVKAGEATTLKTLRDGKEIVMPIKTGRLSFRE